MNGVGFETLARTPVPNLPSMCVCVGGRAGGGGGGVT